ncbi:hypothetical protein [Novosphingobium sp.]|uniref:hypothetical protein n=1 Tax=Novosphingobium sp. TaxID=1874826 RepID=UPI003B528FAB
MLQLMFARCFLATLALISSPVLATETTLCQALDGLKTEAERAGPQRINIFKQKVMTFACGATKNVSAQSAFCTAAAEPVGIEFIDKFPWLIYDCLRNEDVSPALIFSDQYTGINRKKITRLSAKWRDGMRLDISFTPTGDFGPKPKFREFWGTYTLSVWRP